MKLEFAKRTHIQTALGLKIRYCNRLLGELREYLDVIKYKEYVYFINKKGCDLIGEGKPPRKNTNIEHTLMRNDFWLFLKKPNWKVEKKIVFGRYNIIPDACFQTDTLYCIEIDRIQKSIVNEKKFKYYNELNKSFKNQYKKVIIVYFYTTTEYRRKKLETLAKKYDLYIQVYTPDDLR